MLWSQFSYMVWDEGPLSFFCIEYSVFPIPFIHKTILSPLCILGISVKSQLTIDLKVHFEALYSVALFHIPVFSQWHAIFISIALQYSSKSGSMMAPPLLLLLMISLAIWPHLCSIEWRFSILMKNISGFLIGIVLNLQTALGIMDILTILILSINEHMMSFNICVFIFHQYFIFN
jgi:hypothetical protein